MQLISARLKASASQYLKKKLLENMIIIAYDSSLKVGLMILWYDIHQVDLGWLKPMSRYKRWMCSAQQIYWTTN